MNEKPWQIVAYGLAIALIVAAGGWALKEVIPVLVASVAQGWHIATGATAVAAFAPWVLPASQVVFLLSGVTLSITLVRKGIEQAQKKPFDWIAAIFAVLQPLALDFVKEFVPDDKHYSKLIEKAIAFALFTAGLILWKQSVWLAKGVGLFLLFAPPLWVIGTLLAQHWNVNLQTTLRAVPPPSWLALGIMLFASLAAIVMKYKLDT